MAGIGVVNGPVRNPAQPPAQNPSAPAQQVVVQLSPPKDNPEIRAQLFEAASLFFVAVLVVFLAKQLYNLFSTPNDD